MPSRKHAAQFMALVLSVALAFYCRWGELHRGYYADDATFVAMGPLSLPLFARAWNPIAINWFYRPVFLCWFSTFNALGPYSPLALHAGSVALFGIAAFLAGMLAFRLTRHPAAGALAAVLFLTAPNQSEAIWWLSSASTLLAAVFSMIALNCVLSYRDTGRTWLRAASLVSLWLALCSKEDAAPLPLIMILFDLYLRWQTRTLPPRRLLPIVQDLFREYWPIAAMTLFYGALDIVAYRHDAAINKSAHLWHGVDRVNMAFALSFGYRALISDQIGNAGLDMIPGHLLFLAVFVCLLAVSWRRPLVPCVIVAAIVAFLPLPIATGIHTASERFNLLPNLYGSLMFSLLMYYGWRSRDLRTNIVTAGVAWCLLKERGNFIIGPGIAIAISCLLPITAYVVWRILPKLKSIALFCAIAGGLALGGALLEWNIILPAGALGAVLIGWDGFRNRDAKPVILGMAIGLLAGDDPAMTGLIVLIAACWSQTRAQTTQAANQLRARA